MATSCRQAGFAEDVDTRLSVSPLLPYAADRKTEVEVAVGGIRFRSVVDYLGVETQQPVLFFVQMRRPHMLINSSPSEISFTPRIPEPRCRIPDIRKTIPTAPCRLFQAFPKPFLGNQCAPRAEIPRAAFRDPPPYGTGIKKGLYRIPPQGIVLRVGPIVRLNRREIEGAAQGGR